MLASIPRSSSRRSAAVTLAFALSLPLAPSLGGTALAAVPSGPPPPAEASAGLEVVLPLSVEGTLAKDSRRALAERLRTAAAAAKVSGGPYRAKLSVRVSKKKDYALALTVLGADDATVASATGECKACSLEKVGAEVEALVQQAAASLAPAEPPPAATAKVSVRTEPLGARVIVDGTERGVTPLELELPPGEHTIAVDKPGFAPQEQPLTLEAGADRELSLPLAAEAAEGGKGKGKRNARRSGSDARAGRGLVIGGGVVLGLGLAGVAAGVAMILIDEDPMQSRCSGADVDFRGVCRHRYDTLMGGIVGTAAGGLGVAGGLAMMIQGHRIAVRARAGKQEASLGLVVRF